MGVATNTLLSDAIVLPFDKSPPKALLHFRLQPFHHPTPSKNGIPVQWGHALHLSQLCVYLLCYRAQISFATSHLSNYKLTNTSPNEIPPAQWLSTRHDVEIQKTDESYQEMKVYVQSVHSALLPLTSLHVTSIISILNIEKYNRLFNTGRRDTVVSTSTRFICASLYIVVCPVAANYLHIVYLHNTGSPCTNTQYQKLRLQLSHSYAKIAYTYWQHTLHIIPSNLPITCPHPPNGTVPPRLILRPYARSPSLREPVNTKPTTVALQSLQWSMKAHGRYNQRNQAIQLSHDSLQPLTLLALDLAQQRPRQLQYGGGMSTSADPRCLELDTGHHIGTPRSHEMHHGTYLELPYILRGPISVIEYSNPSLVTWQPSTNLAVIRTMHPLDTPWQDTDLQLIKDTCQLPQHSVIAYRKIKPATYITVTDLRNLIEHNSLTIDDTVALFLELYCCSYNTCFLCPQFLPLLDTEGWRHVKRFFTTNTQRKPRTVYCPRLQGEPSIAIPCFVNNNHWVGLVRREVKGQVIFLYVDDLNNRNTERRVKHSITTKTDRQFCPTSARWIVCKNYTYHPHSNECGPRMLIAMAVLMTHPSPHEGILLPYMHPNLAQIARTFVAASLLTGTTITFPQFEISGTDSMSHSIQSSSP
jgi:hypothetical protein